MKLSKRTKNLKKKKTALSIISWFFCFGTTAFLLVMMLSGKEDGAPLREVLGTKIYTFIITNIPLVFLSIMVKDKIKPVCYMINVIMANIAFGGFSIYIIFAIWLCDTYILVPLIDLYKDKYRINREIEYRENN